MLARGLDLCGTEYGVPWRAVLKMVMNLPVPRSGVWTSNMYAFSISCVFNTVPVHLNSGYKFFISGMFYDVNSLP